MYFSFYLLFSFWIFFHTKYVHVVDKRLHKNQTNFKNGANNAFMRLHNTSDGVYFPFALNSNTYGFFFDFVLNESEKGPKLLPYLVISFSFFGATFSLESTKFFSFQLANSICLPFVCIWHRQSSSARLHAHICTKCLNWIVTIIPLKIPSHIELADFWWKKNQANNPTKLINTETLSRATERQIRMWCDHKNIKQRSRNFSSLMWNWAISGCGVRLMHFINNKLKMCKYHRNKNRSCSMRFHQSDDLLLSHFLQQTNWVLIFKRNSRNFSSSLSLSRIYSFEYSIRVRCSYWLGCLNMMHTCLCTQFTYQQAYHKQF